MNKYVNPPCDNLLATSFTKSVIASSCGECKVAAVFTEAVSSSVEGELAIGDCVNGQSGPNYLYGNRSFCGCARSRGVCRRFCGSSEY